MSSVLALPVERLRWRCDPAEFGFETTKTIPPLDVLACQERAGSALEFGLGLDTAGYNLYVASPAGSGHSTAVRARDTRAAAGRPRMTGAISTTGSYPPGTFHARVQERLATMAHRLADFGKIRRATRAGRVAAPVGANGKDGEA
jgi:hypothetical protein